MSSPLRSAKLPLVSIEAPSSDRSRSPARIVIVGGGLGAAALGAALSARQAPCHATLIERSPEPTNDRYGLSIAPNGIAALSSMGVLPRVMAAGHRIRGIEVIPSRFDRGVRFSMDRLPAGDDIGVGILPSVLNKILRESFGPNIDVQSGHELQEVRFEKGLATRVITCSKAGVHEFPADLVVGADGVHSAVRRYVTDEPAIREVDEAYQVMLGDRVPGLDTIQQHVRPGRLLGLVPIGSDRTFVFWLTRRHEVKALRRQPFVQLKAEMLATAPSVEPALSSIRGWEDVLSVKMTLTRCRTWYKRNVVLLGDTVHATTPSLAQGANMSLVDATWLAEAIAAWISSDFRNVAVEPFLSRYVAIRRPQADLQYALGRLVIQSSISRSRAVMLAKLGALGLLSALPASERWTIELITGLWPRRAPPSF